GGLEEDKETTAGIEHWITAPTVRAEGVSLERIVRGNERHRGESRHVWQHFTQLVLAATELVGDQRIAGWQIERVGLVTEVQVRGRKSDDDWVGIEEPPQGVRQTGNNQLISAAAFRRGGLKNNHARKTGRLRGADDRTDGRVVMRQVRYRG